MNSENKSTQHEEATIRAFVVRKKRERFLSFIANPKSRGKFTRELPNFSSFDRRFTTSIPWKVDPVLSLWGKHLQGIENVSRLLRSKGAGDACWVISNNSRIDNKEMDLESALQTVAGSDSGTIISCIPGQLAYFEGDHELLLLAR